MKFLGIDYGSKRVGLATSSEGALAFPHGIVQNDARLIATIAQLCKEQNIGKIILGESKDFDMNDNRIMEDIRKFKKDLEGASGLEIVYEPEFLSSAQAARIQGEHAMLDASAAAVILQSFLDKENNRENNKK